MFQFGGVEAKFADFKNWRRHINWNSRITARGLSGQEPDGIAAGTDGGVLKSMIPALS